MPPLIALFLSQMMKQFITEILTQFEKRRITLQDGVDRLLAEIQNASSDPEGG